MTKDEFISSHRLSLLSRAKSINNISAACRDFGVSRTYHYKWAKDLLPMESQHTIYTVRKGLTCATGEKGSGSQSDPRIPKIDVNGVNQCWAMDFMSDLFLTEDDSGHSP